MRRRPDCPVCRSTSGAVAFRTTYDSGEVRKYVREYYDGRVDERYLDGNELVIRHCGDCGVYWQEQILDDEGMELLYERWIDPEESRKKRDDWDLRERKLVAASRIRRQFDRRPGRVRVLDYGMGWGSFLQAVSAFGCQAFGLEISERRRNHAEERGITTFETVDEIESTFDVITFHQTLEHVADPREMVANATDLLADGGLLHLAVPELPGPPTGDRVLSKGAYQPLEHVNAYSRRALLSLAEDHGMTDAYPPPSLTALERLRTLRGAARALVFLLRVERTVDALTGSTEIYFEK